MVLTPKTLQHLKAKTFEGPFNRTSKTNLPSYSSQKLEIFLFIQDEFIWMDGFDFYRLNFIMSIF